MATDDDQDSGFDPRRRLCPDGSCIGIIGTNGTCTVCGASAGGPPAQPSEEGPAAEAPAEPAALDDADAAADHGDQAAPAFNPKRRLCSDGSCIGVIGSDHRCSVCGRPASG
jgi:hypothetical protein